MAMIFIENFAGATSSSLVLSRGWETDGAAALPLVVTNTSFLRNSQGGVGDFANTGYSIRRYFGGASSTIVVGLAAWFYSAATGSSKRFLRLNEDGATHISLGLDAANQLCVWRGDLTTLLVSTGITPLVSSSTRYFYYIEIETTINDTTGTIKIWVNDVLVSNLSGIDTRNGGTGIVNNLYLSGAGETIITDVYCLDTTGTMNNARIGDCRVDLLLPNGDNSVTWSRSAGVLNYTLVDDTTMDSDSTYVYSSTSGQQDIYDFAGLPSTGNLDIRATSTFMIVRNESASANAVRPLAKIGGFVYNGPTYNLSADVLYQSNNTVYLQETSPATGVAWTKTEINGAAFGIEKV